MTILEHTAPAWLILLAAGLAIGLSGAALYGYAPRNWRSGVLGAVRLLFLLLLAWCLFMPSRKVVLNRTRKPHFLVLFDRSGSMKLTPRDEVPTRWDTAVRALRMPWLDIVGDACEIDIHPFDADLGERIDRNQFDQLEPEGRSTRLREVLLRVASRYAGLNVSGCLLLSDGVDTHEALDDWASEPRPFPIHTVRLEPPGLWRVEADVSVDSVDTPRRVTVDWKTELNAVISGRGTGGQPLTVQLSRDGVLLDECPVTIPDEGGSREATFEIDHAETGVFTYRVFVPPLPDEANTNDNLYAVSVQVVTARNHLLYVEGAPRWESKYLTRVLRANGQTHPLVFLRGPDERMLTIGERGSMTPDMHESQLAMFKIVIIGNLNAEALGPRRAANLVRFVESGGSLVLLGGAEGWGPDGLTQSVMADLLPVKTVTPAPVEGVFPVALTDAGRAHPAFAGDPERWDALPPILSFYPSAGLTPGARVLVTARTDAGMQPIVVSHHYGQGKVVSVFTDSLWRWQLNPDVQDAEPYARFWNQLIAWMLPKQEDLDGPRIQLSADREQLNLGEQVELIARHEAGGAVRCEITGPDRHMLPFTMQSQQVTTPSGGTFDGHVLTYEAEQAGLYTVVAAAQVNGERIQSDPVSFLVKPFTPESIPRAINAEVLRALAKSSDGSYSESVDDLNRLLSSLTIREVEEALSEYRSLWQLPVVLACLISLLTLGWIVRKTMHVP